MIDRDTIDRGPIGRDTIDSGAEGDRTFLPGPEAERSWLRRHAIHPRKRLGQSFLVQPQVADRLVRAISVERDARFLEIGAGAGAMTRALLDAGARVWSVEVDSHLVLLLEERFAEEIRQGRLHLLSGDILRTDPATIPGVAGEPVRLVGNLPYAITTPILLWALAHRGRFRDAAFLIQREVAERLAAPPGSRTYGSITVWIAFHGVVSKLTTVEPGAFWPVPQVDSSLISIRFHEAPPVDADPKALEGVLAAAFGQRRKMIRSSLTTLLGAETARIIEQAGIDPTKRAEALSLADFAAIARAAYPAYP
jgi:16S rRNA (adenine1518-N6/adenine1519-N6)-dimethyltransferase